MKDEIPNIAAAMNNPNSFTSNREGEQLSEDFQNIVEGYIELMARAAEAAKRIEEQARELEEAKLAAIEEAIKNGTVLTQEQKERFNQWAENVSNAASNALICFGGIPWKDEIFAQHIKPLETPKYENNTHVGNNIYLT